MKKKHKRHLTPDEIKEQCKAIARESRMAERTPWTVSGIICAYVIMCSEGFKGQRISNITGKINELEEQWSHGLIDLEEIRKRLQDKAEWTITNDIYTEADIKAKKGSYKYWLDCRQLQPQNTMNEQAARYLLFFYNTLMDDYGFGKDRLTRVQEYMDKVLPEYQIDKTVIQRWKQALLDEAGVVIEAPVDPLTQNKGSIMTG